VLKEMIDALGDLTRKAAAPVPVPILDPRKVSFVVNGMQVTQDVPPTPRDHKAGSLDEIIALANRFGEGATDLGEGQPVVWYDEEKVVLVIDDSGHRVERATLTLDTSDVFACLCRLSKAREWMDQKPFVRLLKLDLAGKVEPPYLIDRARKLKFEATSSSTGVVQRDRESLGRNITSEVTSDGDIPEEVLVNAPVFKTAGERDPYRWTAGNGAEGRCERLLRQAVTDRRTPLIRHPSGGPDHAGRTRPAAPRLAHPPPQRARRDRPRAAAPRRRDARPGGPVRAGAEAHEERPGPGARRDGLRAAVGRCDYES
jgi:hypothetical protein